MTRQHKLLTVLGLAAAMLIPAVDAFARGGRSSSNPPVNKYAKEEFDVNEATTELKNATTAYNAGITAFENDFRKTAEYSSADKAVINATSEVDAARATVIGSLKTGNAEYRVAVQKEEDAKKKLETMRSAKASQEQIAAQSKAILTMGDTVNRMETDALAKDEKYQAAKKKLADASDTLKIQKDKLAETKKTDKTLTDLKAAMDSAKANLDAANKRLREAKVTKSN
jgi:outer membrane protein TolC